jgi:hypothetical protein
MLSSTKHFLSKSLTLKRITSVTKQNISKKYFSSEYTTDPCSVVNINKNRKAMRKEILKKVGFFKQAGANECFERAKLMIIAADKLPVSVTFLYEPHSVEVLYTIDKLNDLGYNVDNIGMITMGLCTGTSLSINENKL